VRRGSPVDAITTGTHDSAESSGPGLIRKRAALRNPSAVGPREHEHAVVGGRDAESPFVQQSVVKAAQRDEVAGLRLAAVDPVPDVVTLAEASAVAAGKTAAAVARAQRALDRDRNRASLAADIQRLAVTALNEADDGAIATEAADGLECERRTAFELGAMRLARPRFDALRQHGLIHVHDDLKAVGARGRFDFVGARCEKGLRHETQRIGSIRRVCRADARPRDLVHVDVRPQLLAFIAQTLLAQHVVRGLERLCHECADFQW